MSGFWIAGIAVNLAVFGGVVWWAVRNWRQADARRRDAADRVR